jgi:hypothetical protein
MFCNKHETVSHLLSISKPNHKSNDEFQEEDHHPDDLSDITRGRHNQLVQHLVDAIKSYTRFEVVFSDVTTETGDSVTRLRVDSDGDSTCAHPAAQLLTQLPSKEDTNWVQHSKPDIIVASQMKIYIVDITVSADEYLIEEEVYIADIVKTPNMYDIKGFIKSTIPLGGLPQYSLLLVI